jgi:hypothetical protein
MFSYGEGNKAAAVDISGMKYLEFDVFVSDPAIIADVEFSFELTSGGTADQQENAKKFKGKDTGWVQGWNHVKWELTEFDAKTGGELDFTKWNYIRWYNDSALNATNWLQVGIKDIKFTGDPTTTPDQPDQPDQPDVPEVPEEDKSIKLPIDTNWYESWLEESFHDVASQVRIYGGGGTFGAGGFMFVYKDKQNPVDISGVHYIEFDVYISDITVIDNVDFSFELTSGGDSDQQEIAHNFKGKDTGWVNGWNHVKWDLKKFDRKTGGDFDATAWNYIRWYNDSALVAPGYFEVGIANVVFTQKTAEELDADEETATEHCVPLWGANSGWDRGDNKNKWTVDKENPAAGSGCISVNLKDRVDVMAPEKHFETPINATGMDTLEFDIYLSDLAIVDYFSSTDGAIEITSSGTSDSGEVAYNFRNLTKYKLKDAQVGWNHISIRIKDMETNDGAAGPFDISAVNFIRIYWVHPQKCDQDWILKFDNIRLTDAQKQLEAEEDKKAQEILAKYPEVLEKIDALKDITAVTDENYADVKAQYDEAKAAFDAIPAEDQTVVAGKGYSEKLMAASKLITEYEEDVATLEANKALIDSMKALDVYKDASAFTAENYAEAKAAIEAVRTAYDALPRATRNLLKDKGYLAYLEAAETAMPAEAPAGTTDPGTTDPGTTDPGKKGCGSALTIGAAATMILAGAWVAMAARKKED